MKKILCFLMVTILALGIFVGCGEDKKNTAPKVEVVEEEPEEKVAEFEPIVIVDNEFITFTITSFEPDNDWGPTLKVNIKNNSDKNIMVGMDDASVNDIMMDPFWAKSITAGKSANSNITWYTENCEENGIEFFETIEFSLRVSDEDTWDTLFNESGYILNIE